MPGTLRASPLKHRFRARLFRFVFGLGLILTVCLGVSLAFPHHAVAGSTHPGGDVHDPVVLNIDITRPAVVRMGSDIRATLQVQLCGNISDTLNPRYSYLGSGAFISSHGDILTADHVVNVPNDQITSDVLQIEANNLAADFLSKCGKLVDPATIPDLLLNNPSLFSVSGIQKQFYAWLDTSYVGSYAETSLQSVKTYPITVKSESTFDRNDIAIVHINLDDTPSVPIGDSDSVSPTDKLTVIGYPGNADLADRLSAEHPNNFLTSSINELYVSAIKVNNNGGTLLQVGGNIEHGDSGGPALNAHGQIVGVVSFGIAVSDPNQVGETRFLQASSSAQPLVAQAHIDTTPGNFQKRWHQAMTDFAATDGNHWHNAFKEMSSLLSDYPLFAGITPYLTYAQQQSQTETGTASSQQVTQYVGYGLIGLAGIVLVITVVTVLISNNRRRARKKALVAVAANYLKADNPPNIQPTTYGYGGYTNGPPTGAPTYGQPPTGQRPPNGYGGSAPPSPSGQGPQGRYAGQTPPPPSTGNNTCVNGHPMMPYETYCQTCGAARAQS